MPKRKKKSISNGKQTKMVELVKSGLSGCEIAKELSVSTSTVYRYLNMYAVENNIPKEQLRVQPHRKHVFTDPFHKTWPIGSHQNINSNSNIIEDNIEDSVETMIEENPKEEIPEVGVEDTAVTTIEENPKEEIPEVGVEDADESNNSKDNIFKLIDKIRSIIAQNNEIIGRVI